MYQRSNTQSVVEAALCIALAVVFSRLRLFRLPQGGSVTLEIVPLLVYAMRWGLCKGIGAGAVAGLLQYVLGGYVIHPVQGLLDYPLAYAALGLAALGGEHVFAGILIAVAARIVCHVASGVVFFASYAPAGTHPLVYSLLYNGGFMAANMAIAMVLVPLILARLKKF